MPGHKLATPPGEVLSFPPLPPFLILDLVDLQGIPGELIVKKVKHPSWWWESRTPRWRVFEALPRTRRRTLLTQGWLGLWTDSIELI